MCHRAACRRHPCPKPHGGVGAAVVGCCCRRWGKTQSVRCWGLSPPSGISSGKGYVDVSTVDVATSQQIGSAVAAKSGLFLEAPVSGSKGPAEQGVLACLYCMPPLLLQPPPSLRTTPHSLPKAAHALICTPAPPCPSNAHGQATPATRWFRQFSHRGFGGCAVPSVVLCATCAV